METDRVKIAIKDQLQKFDAFSKKIALAKEAAATDPTEKGKLESRIEEANSRIKGLQDEIAKEERVTYNILTENPNNLKQLEKQHQKIEKLKGAINDEEGKIASHTARIEEITKKEAVARELGSLQEGYKQCLNNLMNLRSRFTQAYDEAEQESGIYFLSSPK
ncbi:MAG: hypothetical protein JW839_10885 [Candidatus Lokiarchaeota archaeon]|nr:hypothetical protein [Candidatus Lokiarchaeota archaeon]